MVVAGQPWAAEISSACSLMSKSLIPSPMCHLEPHCDFYLTICPSQRWRVRREHYIGEGVVLWALHEQYRCRRDRLLTGMAPPPVLRDLAFRYKADRQALLPTAPCMQVLGLPAFCPCLCCCWCRGVASRVNRRLEPPVPSAQPPAPGQTALFPTLFFLFTELCFHGRGTKWWL